MKQAKNKPPKKIIDLAIIIPTLNEQYFIGKLLDSIIEQTVQPAQLVVVDAYSGDKTIGEVKKRQELLPQLKVFKIQKHTISRQRNFGVKKTTSAHLLFLDADMELRGKDVLKRYFNQVLAKKPDVAAAKTLPDSDCWKDLVYFELEDLLIKVSKVLWPVITARNLYFKREAFNKVGGFDEDILVGEDQELVHRMIKAGAKFYLLKKISLYTSSRRVEAEGRRKYVLRMLLFGINILLFGRKKANVKYEFGKFTKL